MTREEILKEEKREMTKVEIRDFDDFYQKVCKDVLKWAPKDAAFIAYLKSDEAIDQANQFYEIFEETAKKAFGYFVNYCVEFTAFKLYTFYDGAKKDICENRVKNLMSYLCFRESVEYPESTKKELEWSKRSSPVVGGLFLGHRVHPGCSAAHA